MRWLPCTAIVIALAPQPVEVPKGVRIPQANSTVVGKQSNSPANDQHDPKNPIEALGTSANNGDRDAAIADENIRIQRKLVLFTALLVVAAFVTAGVIGWQSWETRKAANAAKISAEASRLGAEAVITENRPWLLIPPGDAQKGIQTPYLVPVEENMGTRMSHCIFFVKNYGNTPGQVFASNAELQLGDSPSEPPDLRAYDMEKAKHDTVTFPPGESIPNQALLMPLAFIKMDDLTKVMRGGKYLWFCGFLRYRDTFDRPNTPEHETKFCYLYENRLNTPAPFWKAAGPTGYNEAT